MKFVTNLFQGKPPSLEEGPGKYQCINEYLVLHRDENRTNCGKFVQIVKVILFIELIILIGWLGYVSFSYYNTFRNTDCGVSTIGCTSSKTVYDDIEVKNNRSVRSIEATEDGREKCERIANATRRGLDNLADQYVAGEPSDPTVFQLRQNLTELAMYVANYTVTGFLALEGFFRSETPNTEFITTIPNDEWQILVEPLSEKFVNSTDSQNRHRLKLRGPPTEEMANEFRDITASLYLDVRECDRRFADSFLSASKYKGRWRRELEPESQLTIDCRDAEAQLLKERRERLEAFAADVASGWHVSSDNRNFLTLIESALNATSPSEVTVDEVFLYDESGMKQWKRFLSNASLELKKEFYELVRDEYLENRRANHDSPDWEGYDMYWTYRNWTDGLSILLESKSPRVPLDLMIKYGKAYNLRYVEAEREDSSVDSEAPAFGTFVNLDSESETLGVRRMRHILDGFVRLYFRVINRLGPCKPAGLETSTRDRRSVNKRSVTVETVQKSITTKCWSEEEEEKILAEERLERQAAYASRLKKKEADVSYTKAFFRGIEAALNATSRSEIHFEHDPRKWSWLTYVEYLSENSSLEVRKEGYALIRDLYLELYELKNHHPEWSGYNLYHVVDNPTASNFFSVDYAKKALFNHIVRYGNAFNLRYEKFGNRESGAELSKPMLGKFTYVGKEPEKLSTRQRRRILDAFVKFQFKTQHPSSVCKGETPTTSPELKTTNATCWNTEQDPALLEERRERLKGYAIWNEGEEQYRFHMKKHLDAIGKALNATSAAEIYSDDFLLKLIPELTFIKNSTMNSSLELYKEGLEISRDMKLAFDELKEHTSKWKGLEIETVLHNMTESIKAVRYKTGDSGDNSESVTPEIISNNYNALGRPFNLRYEVIENGDGGNNTDKLVLGKFIYLGEEPEKLGVRHFRHILNAGARLYFRVINGLETCTPTAGETPTRDRRSVKKRFVTGDPIPKSTTIKCWSEEDVKILAEERQDRLAAYASRLKKKEADVSYWKAYLKGIEAALNATSITEIHFEPDPRKLPWLTYVESLSENSSLEVRKEGYALIRDLYIELYKLKYHHPEWDGYDFHRIVNNLTAGNFFSVDFTKGGLYNDIVKYSNVFDLRYEELGNRASGAEPNKPVFGKFTYVGDEPENLGTSQLRHILDAFVKFYFKTQDPSSVCKSETPTTGSESETTNAQCWYTEQDPAFLEERRERLNFYAIWNERDDPYDFCIKNMLDAIGKALNATSASEIHFDENVISDTPRLAYLKNITMNCSLELFKEHLAISRDLILEFDELKAQTSKWEGWDVKTVLYNLTESMDAECNKTGDCGNKFESIKPEMMSRLYAILAGAFNMRYEEIEIGDGGDKTNKPVFGKFTYVGEEPEQLGVRHMRHIFDGLVRVYFKIQYPSIAAMCNSSAEEDGSLTLDKLSKRQ